MNSYERILAMFEHREADRIPMTDSPWEGTLSRWRREGLPANEAWDEHFGFDVIGNFGADTSPRYEEKIVEETETHITRTTSWGVTLRQLKQQDSTPEFLHFTVTDPDSWRKAKERMTPSEDRVNWAALDRRYKRIRSMGGWVTGDLWFGFDITHSWFVGTETLLVAMCEEPEWCVEMFNHELDMSLAHMDMILDRGYRIDSVKWPDDMGYKNCQFFSGNMYRELLKPVQKRACDWAHARGIKTHLHSCGDINPFVPDLIEIGIDALNPLEVKAGMDPIALKKKYGDKLVLHGGLNAVLYDNVDEFIAEMDRVIPVLKENGGYIFSSDHSIPNNVSYADMKRIAEHAHKIGKY